MSKPSEILADPRVFDDLFAKEVQFDGDVEVYLNLHKLKVAPDSDERVEKVWSVKDPKSGRVLGHARRLVLTDVSFWVNEGGRQRVLETGRKTVHAQVRGKVLFDPEFRFPPGGTTISYNPKMAPWFKDASGNPVYGADMVEFPDVSVVGNTRFVAYNPVFDPPLKVLERIRKNHERLERLKGKNPEKASVLDMVAAFVESL